MSNIITIDTNTDATIYGKGDTCLLINPFDTYHLFRLYNNWNSDSKKLLNLANGNQKIYLVFKSNKSEIRISEFENSGSSYTVDRSNGEVLFKITKENATSILALTSNTFYITRKIEEIDSNGNVLYTSGEEVLYTGKWADESKWTSSSLSATINSLQQQLNSANSSISTLTNQLNQYKLSNESLTSANEALQEQVDALQDQVDTLQEQIDEYESANEFTSVVISDNATYNYYKGDQEVDANGDPITNSSSSSSSKIVAGTSGTLTEAQLQSKVESLLQK